MQCPTMRIKTEASPENEAGFVVINAEDFDPATMTDFDADANADAVKLTAAAEAKAAAEASEAAEAAAKLKAAGTTAPWAN